MFCDFRETWRFWVLQRTRQADLQWWWFLKTALPDCSLGQDKAGGPSGIAVFPRDLRCPVPMCLEAVRVSILWPHSFWLGQTGTSAVKRHTDDFLKWYIQQNIMFNLLLPRRRDVVPGAVCSKSFSSSTAPGDVVSGSSLLAGARLGWCIHAAWFQAIVCIFVFPGNQRLWASDTWEISGVLSRRSTASWARKPFLINAAMPGHSMPMFINYLVCSLMIS